MKRGRISHTPLPSLLLDYKVFLFEMPPKGFLPRLMERIGLWKGPRWHMRKDAYIARDNLARHAQLCVAYPRGLKDMAQFERLLSRLWIYELVPVDRMESCVHLVDSAGYNLFLSPDDTLFHPSDSRAQLYTGAKHEF